MSITAANAVYLLSIANLFPTPVQLQGFAVDDIFTTDPFETVETLMGVDGKLSGGLVFVPVKQGILFQADSPSISIFDTWYASQRAIKDVYVAQGIVTLTGIASKWALSNGFLSMYPPIPDVGRVLKPRKFEITWESVLSAPA
jgi:hypothetical protein